MTEEAETLRIYIDYDYLAAEQLGGLLSQLHEIYSTILYSEAPYMRQLPSAPQARLRVDAINTGGSILISLVQGVTQVVGSSDPMLIGVTSGIAALGTAGTIILRLLSRSLDVRAKWRRGDREDEAARIELDSRHLDLESHRLEVLGKQLEFRARAENQVREQGHREQEHREIVRQVLAEQLPQRLPQQREELVDQLATSLDIIIQQLSQDNIRQVSVTAPDQSS